MRDAILHFVTNFILKNSTYSLDLDSSGHPAEIRIADSKVFDISKEQVQRAVLYERGSLNFMRLSLNHSAKATPSGEGSSLALAEGSFVLHAIAPYVDEAEFLANFIALGITTYIQEICDTYKLFDIYVTSVEQPIVLEESSGPLLVTCPVSGGYQIETGWLSLASREVIHKQLNINFREGKIE